MKATTILITILSVIISQNLIGQTNKEIALQKAREALKLEDEKGLYDEAIKLLEEAQKLDPENIIYPYELAYAYSGKREYSKASDILEKLVNHNNVYGRIYQALGNAYDYQGKPEKAIETYEIGLKKFPNSGELYLELGNMQMARKDYDKALEYYENGIKNDPKFPSNYYWASILFCNSSEKVWGMIYGEIFMNLERNTKRTSEISKLLFETYLQAIKITSDSKERTTLSISFSSIGSENNPLTELGNGKNSSLPFGIGVYEPTIALTLIDIKKINLSSLNTVRTRFIENYIKNGKIKEYPIVLFEYQNTILKAEHFEAYNYWLLMKGNEDEFQTWRAENNAKFDSFIAWFSANKLNIDIENKFYRMQY